MESPLDGENVYDYLPVTRKQFFRETGRTAFVGSDSFLYYEPPRKDMGPDFYVVNGGVQRRQKKREGFHLENGESIPATPNAQGRIACRSLPLLLGTHEGWLGWFTPEGELLRTGQEQVATERLAAKRERASGRQAIGAPRGRLPDTIRIGAPP